MKRSLETESLGREPLNITVAGHSFINHLNTFACNNYGYWHNFKMEQEVATVKCIGISGATVEKMINLHLHRIVDNKPNIVYLEVGTNDLCDPSMMAKQVADRIKELCVMIHNLGAKRVVVGEVTFRVGRGIPGKTPDFNYKVLSLNKRLQVLLDHNTDSSYFFWRHKYLWNSQLNLYRDGVHYNKDGNRRLFRSIRGALLKMMWEVRSTE